jgi:hypothetical protein
MVIGAAIFQCHSETGGAEVRDRYSASDDDPLIDNADDAVGQKNAAESLTETEI